MIWSLFYKFKISRPAFNFSEEKAKIWTKKPKRPKNFVGNKADFVEAILMNTVNIICAPVIHPGRLNVLRKHLKEMNGCVLRIPFFSPGWGTKM